MSSRSTAMDTAYHPVHNEKSEVQAYMQKRKRKWPTSLHILSHLIGLFWMAPILLLLVFNFKKHVIGASVWCPKGRCNAEVFDSNAIDQASKLDRADHDILGALQFVAKGLEVWFMVIATALVYDVALFIAKRGGGLPIGYLFTYLEFTDIRNLINPLMWTSPIPHGNLMPRKPSGIWKLYMFAVLAAFLTILTNLMGPAVAVLVLPTLQWVDTNHSPDMRFESYSAVKPPTVAAFPTCNDAQQLALRNYTCTADEYAASLDNLATQLNDTIAQGGTINGTTILATAQEAALAFTANMSKTGDLVWVPTRQVLRELSADFVDVTGLQADVSQASQERLGYNNSPETVLQREGPSLGFTGSFNVGNLNVKNLEVNKQVRCLTNWTSDDITHYTKCYRAGLGWGELNNMGNFSLGDSNTTGENDSTVLSYFSDRAMFFNESTDFGSGIQACLGSDTNNCDWEAIFKTEVDPALKNSSLNLLVTEYTSPSAPTSEIKIFCDAVIYSGFPTYSVDTSPSVNPQILTSMNGLPLETDKSFNTTSLPVSPDWLLAAWSVSNNGAVSRERLVGKSMAQSLASMFDNYQGSGLGAAQFYFYFLHIYTITQSLSMINYEFTSNTTSTPSDSQGLGSAQPLLSKWSTLRVWAYGLTGRTAKMGVVVTGLGCICVLLRLILALALRIRHEHSTVELFVAALEHHPTNEFENLDDESKMARVRYIMEDGDGKPKFVSERVYGGGLGIP
jgi:hypothetical protein